ncbi:hypothetical protein [Stutzerimonas chloritidismutans]
MPLDLNVLFSLNAGAASAARAVVQPLLASAYYFFGYWFSHRRA